MAKLSDSGKYLHLVNKFDYLSNGKSLTGFHATKEHQLAEKGNTVSVTYVDVLEAFMATENAEDFVRLLKPELL